LYLYFLGFWNLPQGVIPMLDHRTLPSSTPELLWRAAGGFDRDGCGPASLKIASGNSDITPVGPGVSTLSSEVNITPGIDPQYSPNAMPTYFEKNVFRFEGPGGVEFTFDSVDVRRARRAGNTLRLVQVRVHRLLRTQNAGCNTALWRRVQVLVKDADLESPAATISPQLPSWLPAGYTIVSAVEVDCPACNARRERYAQFVPRAVPQSASSSCPAIFYGGAVYRIGEGVTFDGFMGPHTRTIMRSCIQGTLFFCR
jgi:hypothetical protein